MTIITKNVINNNKRRLKRRAGAIGGGTGSSNSDNKNDTTTITTTGVGISIKLLLILTLFCLYNIRNERISIKDISVTNNINNIIDFTGYFTTAVTDFYYYQSNNDTTVTDSDSGPHNPYEGWQPTIHTDSKSEEGLSYDGDDEQKTENKCHTWRTCFLTNHGCPGKCRDGIDDWGIAPSVPADTTDGSDNTTSQEQWIPDVTVLRRMMISGKDSIGNPWPPPLIVNSTRIDNVNNSTDRELCDSIGVFGGTNDENLIALNAAQIRGMPMVRVVVPQPTDKDKNENEKEQKQKQPRILCMIYTMEQNHHTSIRAIRETWYVYYVIL